MAHPVRLLPHAAVQAALLGDAPAFATHTEIACVVLMPLAVRVTLVQEAPWPLKGVPPSGSVTDVEHPHTNAIRSEFAAGVYVPVVAYDVAALVL
jgi:hypothetical protein